MRAKRYRSQRGQPRCVSVTALEQEAPLLSGLTLERNRLLQHGFNRSLSSHLGAACFSFGEARTNKCAAQQETMQWFCSHASTPRPFLCFMVGSHRRQQSATRPWRRHFLNSGLALPTLISSSVFGCAADPQALPLTAQTQ